MDGPAIAAAEEFANAGYPLNVEALLIVELDGPAAEVEHLIERVNVIARDCRAVSCKASRSEDERELFWAGRKAAFPAVGRISPDYYCMHTAILRQLEKDIDAVRFDAPEGKIELPVKLRVHDSKIGRAHV